MDELERMRLQSKELDKQIKQTDKLIKSIKKGKNIPQDILQNEFERQNKIIDSIGNDSVSEMNEPASEQLKEQMHNRMEEMHNHFQEMHLRNQQSATMHNDDGAPKTPAFYQKHYQYMYDRDRWKVWDNIIPENAEEMIGALMFCKVHKDDSSVVETLKRLHELCSLHYADNEEINKILPSTQQILKQYAEDKAKKNKKEARSKKRRRIAIISCIALILIQVLCLGWWSILSGAATIAVFGGIWLFKN